jgi:hypothetical protein
MLRVAFLVTQCGGTPWTVSPRSAPVPPELRFKNEVPNALVQSVYIGVPA